MIKFLKNPLVIYTIISVPIIIFLLINVLDKKEMEEFGYILTKDEISVNRVEEVTVEGWALNNIIRVDVKKPGEYEYSFDGGYTWQKENTFVALENGDVNILVKNNLGISEKVEYKVTKVDSVKPVITFNLSKPIYVGDKVDLSLYVNAVDYLSGLNGPIEITPRVLDTSKAGTVEVVCSAKDKVNNLETLTFSVEILDKKHKEENKVDTGIKEDKKELITMYRYRSINDVSYACSEFDCSYLDKMDFKNLEKKYTKTGKCDENLNIKVTFNNGCVIRPYDFKTYCTQAITTVDRYYEINSKVIDIYALGKDGNQVYRRSNVIQKPSSCISGTCKTEEDFSPVYKENNEYNSTNSEGFVDINSEYKAAPCGKDEIELYGYCHAICSYVNDECPEGYKKDGDKCYKYTQKTCSNTCTKTVMSEWSEWSTTKISESDKIQVQTKIVEK